jgi:hypothetical protein
MRAIAFGLIKAQVLEALGPLCFDFQSLNYNSYITILNSICQVESYLTYAIIRNILMIWQSHKYGIRQFINASDATMFGYLATKNKRRMFARNVKALIGINLEKLPN